MKWDLKGGKIENMTDDVERRKQGKKRERKKSVAVFSGIDDAVGVVGVVVGGVVDVVVVVG